jgi:hypothetical protein
MSMYPSLFVGNWVTTLKTPANVVTGTISFSVSTDPEDVQPAFKGTGLYVLSGSIDLGGVKSRVIGNEGAGRLSDDRECQGLWPDDDDSKHFTLYIDAATPERFYGTFYDKSVRRELPWVGIRSA